MALTDYSDIYAALHDAGINRVITLFMKDRPALFNYGTQNVVRNPGLWCSPINTAPGVTHFMTEMPPLPVMMADNLYLDYCVQLTDLKFDFYPSDTISLPSQLKPFQVQNFAIQISACAGLGCTPFGGRRTIPPNLGQYADIGKLRSVNKQYNPITGPRTVLAANTSGAPGIADIAAANIASTQGAAITGVRFDPGAARFPGIRVLPADKLECFCLSVFVTGTAAITGTPPHQSLTLNVNKVEIVDMTPTGLENSLECYMALVLDRGVIPQFMPGISQLLFSPLSLGPMGDLVFSGSTTAPHNPAIEESQLKVYVNLYSIDLTLPPMGGGGTPWPDPVSRYIPTRTRTDAFDLTTAVSETALREVFQLLGNQFTWSKYGGGSWGPFSANYGIAVSVHDCNLELRSDHKMTISFNINLDKLYLDLGIDIPTISIPGFCLVPPLFPHSWCAVWIPGTSFFSANPDIVLPLDISGILSAALTFTAAPVVYYGVGAPNRWMLYVNPDPSLTNLTINGIGDIPGTLFANAVDGAIASLGLPGWAEDVIEAIIGPIVDVVKAILGIAGNAIVWIIDFLGNTLGLWNLLKVALLSYLGNNVPLLQFQDPLPILPAALPEIEVDLPIGYLNATVYDTELVLTADIGG